MAFYLGFDAGGTKTECALAQDGVILARATGGTIKVMRASPEQAQRNLDEVLQVLTTQTGIDLQAVSCTCVGLAGISVPRIADFVRNALCARVGGDLLLAGDEEIALDAAFCRGPGVLVIAGTGSNLIARASRGQLVHIGGWGPAVADEGSGNWIGKQAVRAIFDALDRGERTLLQAKVLEAWELPDLGALIDHTNRSPGPDFSMLTPTVLWCAEQADGYAMRILRQAGEDLGRYAALAMRRVLTLERDPLPVKLPEVAFSGSILRCMPQVRAAMNVAILREFPAAVIQSEAVDPVQGALWRAREASRPTSAIRP
jgi:N-acetylglucosamine kinase-like BadF-type ATPase